MPTVMITGASRGLGLEFARQYSEDGWKVIATCRKPKEFCCGNDVRVEKLDITDESSISALAKKLEGEPIDLLINNAGILSGSSRGLSANDDDAGQSFNSLDAAAWGKVLYTNCISQMMVTQKLMSNLRLSGHAKIIMMSSRWGSLESVDNYSPDYIAYRSSKAALNMAMRILAQTLMPEEIIVVSLNPGWVKTDMGGEGADITPEVSVTGMRKVIDGLTMKKTGLFFRYSGEPVPW